MPDMPHNVPRMANTISDEKAREIEESLNRISGGEVYKVAVDEEAKAQEVTDEVAVDATDTESEVSDAVVESKVKEAADEDSDDSSGAPLESADESPTLPDNYIRSLKATGWNDEEIQKLVDHDFDLAQETAEKIHQHRLRESREWAAHGRYVREGEAPTPSTQEVTPSQSSKIPNQLSRVDAEALRKEYAEDELALSLIDKLVGPTNKAIEAMNIMLPQVAESAARQEESEAAVAQKVIDSFFASPDLAAFVNLYGSGSTRTVANDHFQNRMKVMEQADQIRVGAFAQERNIDLSEAMELAHDSVSAPFQMQAIREEIKTKVQKRAKAVSLKPSKMKNVLSPGDRSPKSREELIESSTRKLREIFG